MSKRNMEDLLQKTEYAANLSKCNAYLKPSDRGINIDNYNIVTSIIPELFIKTDARLCDILQNDVYKLLIDTNAQVYIENGDSLAVLEDDGAYVWGTITPSKYSGNKYKEGRVVLSSEDMVKEYIVTKNNLTMTVSINGNIYVKTIEVNKETDNLDISVYENNDGKMDLILGISDYELLDKCIKYAINHNVVSDDIKCVFPEIYETPSYIKTR